MKKMPDKLLFLISFLVGFVSSGLGDRFIGGGYGKIIGLACGIILLVVVYLLILRVKERRSEKETKGGS